MVGSFEERVVFGAFHQFVRLPAPWDFLVVTLGLYSLFALVTLQLYFSGHSRESSRRTSRNISTCVAIVGAGAAAFALDLPVYLFPTSLIAAYAVVAFFYEGGLAKFVLFVGPCFACFVWFIHKTLWKMEYDMVGEITMQEVCVGVVVHCLALLLIWGCFTLKPNPLVEVAVGFFFFAQSSLLAFIEFSLYHTKDEIEMYPWLLIPLTTFVGVYVSRSLCNQKYLPNHWVWIIQSVYLSKLVVLLTSAPTAVPYFFTYVLAVTASYYFAPSSTSKGFAMALAIGVTSFLCRRKIGETLLTLLTGQQPEISGIFAGILLMWGVGCVPLCLLRFRGHSLARHLVVLLVGTGLIFGLVRPDMSLLSFSDFFHSLFLNHHYRPPHQPAHTLLLYSSWRFLLSSRWLAALGAVFGLVAVTLGRGRGPVPVKWRWIGSVAVLAAGGLSGLAIAAAYLPYSPFLWFCSSNLLLLLAAYLLVLFYPSFYKTSDPNFNIPQLVYSLILLLAFILIVSPGVVFQGIQSSIRQEVLTIYRMVTLVNLSAINFIIAACTKWRVIKSSTSASWTGEVPHSIPLVGNISTVLCVVLGCILNIEYLNGSIFCIFVLCPLFLLLSNDRVIIPDLLGENNRYFPILGGTFYVLGATSLYQLWWRPYFVWVGFAVPSLSLSLGWLGLVRNFAFLGLTFPAQFYVMRFLIWWIPLELSWWMTITPLCLFALVLGDFLALQLLGGLCLISAIVCCSLQHNFAQRGKQII